jgi:hypothetical protein
MTHPGGRPPFYETVEELQAAVDKYLNTCPEDQLTVTGLALSLGFTSRQALLNYEEKPQFVDAVKKAKLRVENAYELSLRKNGRSGDIFGLKNFGWKDNQDLNVGGQGKDNPVYTDSTIKLTPEEAYKRMLNDS